MKKIFSLFVLVTVLHYTGLGQVNISVGTTITEPFTIGTSATATLPSGWKADKNTTVRLVGSYSSAVTATEQRAGNSMSSSATNGIYNYAAGDPTAATDRAVGGISSSSASKSVNIYVQLSNNGESSITDFTISYAVEKYRNGSNAAGYSIQMYYSTNGTTWTSAGSDFLTSFSADADNNGYTSAPGTTVNVSNKTLSVSLAASSSLYLAWNYSVTSGTTTSNAQALGIDDVSITANGSITAPTTQAHHITFSGISTTGMTPSWTNGDGSKRVVIMNTENSFTDPADGDDPGANPVYGGSGEQVIYNNSSNTVTVSGLTASTTYWYRVYEYNGSGATTKYLTSTATGNPNSQITNGSASAPSISSPTATSISNNSATLGGNITSDGGDDITARGTVWKTSSGVAITDNPLAEGGTATGVFSHSRTSLPAKTLIFYKAYATNTIGTTLTDEASFYTLADEPTTHVTGFAAVSGGTTSIDLSWTGTSTGADGYLILQRTGGSAPTGTPSDATAYSVGNTIGDGTVAAIVTDGAQTSQSISGLTPITQYSFTIIPYAWDAAHAQTYNYLTSATIPSANATTDEPPATTYTWNVASGNWNTAASWTPVRTTPATNDILVFDGSTQATPAVTLDFTTPQSIGRLRIMNNASVTFGTSAATRTLNIGYTGAASPQLEVGAGSTLTVSAANAVTINVLSGFTGSISGNIIFQNAAQKLTAADAGGITFTSGAVFTAGTSFSGNPFGSTGTGGSVVFANGSTYVQQAGSNPFATTPAIVTFQTGSLFRLEGNLSPSFSGRTYANFELNYNGSISVSGTGAVSIDNLTVTQGTLNFNMTGTPGHSIKGNITVADGAALNFSPGSSGTVNFNGSAQQTISGTGTIASATTNSTLTMANTSGIVLNTSATFYHLTISSGSLTINANKALTVSGTLTNAAGASGLVIESGGSMIQSNAVPATVKRTINAWSDDLHGWHFLSSPVTTHAIDPIFTNPTPANYDFYAWWEATNQWVNFKNTTASPTWNDANGSTNFNVGQGYLVAYASTDTKQFTGTLNKDDVTCTSLVISAGTNRGWHLLGNPYTSYLNWGTGSWSLTNISSTAKIWNEAEAAYVDITSGGPHTTIPPLNGFMVQASGGTGSLTIPTAARTHGTDSWYKSAGNPYILLAANDPSGSTCQESIISFNSETTAGFDPAFDAHFLPGYAPQFYSEEGEEQLSTNSLPNAGGTVQIPFNFIKNNGTNFSIEAKEISDIWGPVYLNDLKLGNSQDLTTNPVYAFTSATGDNPARFLVTFSHVGIGENQKDNVFTVYSSGDQLIVVDNSGKNQGDVVVYNMMGQAIASGKLNGNAMLKLSMNVPTGYYLVRITSPQTTQSSKVFVR